jgi:hypothetical protein
LCLTEAADFFFVAPDGGGDGVQCGAEVGDFGGETGEGVRFPTAGAVFFDDGAQVMTPIITAPISNRSPKPGGYRSLRNTS